MIRSSSRSATPKPFLYPNTHVRKLACALLVISSAGAVSLACSGAERDTTAARQRFSEKDVLPLVRVRLYASGVGYFERNGRVDGGQSVLPVPAGHLDDALKSLVLLDAEGLGSVSFPSRLSPAVARARAGLPSSQDSVLSYDRLLVALRGELVELVVNSSRVQDSNPKTVSGRVIDVVAVQPSHPSYDHGLPNQRLADGESVPEAMERLQVLLLTDDGGIVRLDASELVSVRAVDELVSKRLNAALSARLATRSNQHQLLQLTSKRAPTDVRLAYLAEAPTWRPSYRLLLDEPNDASRLQAWALIHNDTDEPWRKIQLELVDGHPNSFLFPMTAPRYERRHLETPDTELSSVPQLSTTTPDALWGDFSEYDGEAVGRVGDEGLSGVGSGQGFGSGHGRLGGSHRTAKAKVSRANVPRGSTLLWAGDLARAAGVVPVARETTSVFRVDSTLDLAPQHSAMVPFMDAAVAASAIVWFDELDAQAERAIRVSNNTRKPLPAGPLAVYGRGGFLGEAMLEDLKPGDRQFARIADEPDASIKSTRTTTAREIRHVEFDGDGLSSHYFQTSTRQVSFNNQSGRQRRAYVSLPVVLNASVSGSEAVDYERSSGRAFAVFDVPAGGGKARTLEIREAMSTKQHSDALTELDLEKIIETETVPARERDIVRAALPLLTQWRQTRLEEDEVAAERTAIEAKLDRLRKHLDALAKGETGEAHGQLMQRILEREDELSDNDAKRRLVEEKVQAARSTFEEALDALNGFKEEILEQRKQAAEQSRR